MYGQHASRTFRTVARVLVREHAGRPPVRPWGRKNTRRPSPRTVVRPTRDAERRVVCGAVPGGGGSRADDPTSAETSPEGERRHTGQPCDAYGPAPSSGCFKDGAYIEGSGRRGHGC